MTPNILKGIGIGCFVLGAFLLFFAFERYQANADNVAAMKQLMDNTALGVLGMQKIKPATPTASKYAAFFGVLAIVGGIGCFVIAPKMTAKPGPPFDE